MEILLPTSDVVALLGGVCSICCHCTCIICEISNILLYISRHGHRFHISGRSMSICLLQDIIVFDFAGYH